MEFHNDAICLSGVTGTYLKSKIIGQYYQFWWQITSGGQQRDYGFPTSIVELNAATGEIFIEELKETILGSAGHALIIKEEYDYPNKLKIVLVEEDTECYQKLLNVITRKFSSFPIKDCTGPIEKNKTNVFVINQDLSKALDTFEKIKLGNSIFFFDPLRMVEWKIVETVAKKRLLRYYQTGTEFIIFLFTSDYFQGRKDFAAFPTHLNESKWTEQEKRSVYEADALFGDTSWRELILNDNSLEDREEKFIQLYQTNLLKWFRYVLPLPFNPKRGQIYHLIICSNYEAGIRETTNHYRELMQIPRYSPNNNNAYIQFKRLYPEICAGYKGMKRPMEWKILWKIIKQETGIRDYRCADMVEFEESARKKIFDWLSKQNLIRDIQIDSAWTESFKKYVINWEVVSEKLEIEVPPRLIPISPDKIPDGFFET